MPNNLPAKDILLAVQQDILRLAKRDHGLTEKRLSALTHIPCDTIKSWTKGVAMPAWAFAMMTQVIPDHLTSLLFEQFDKFVGTDEPSDGDLDRLARESAEYNVEYLGARDPNSDGGSAITPREKRNLQDRSRRIASIARRAAA